MLSDDGIDVSFKAHGTVVDSSPMTVSIPVSEEFAAAIEAAIRDAERFGSTPDFVVIDGVEYRIDRSGR